MADLLARQQAEKDYTPMGQIKPGPQLGWAGSGVGGGLGSWASQFAGSKIGGGLGSMLFGPWGMLLGSLFGRGVGKRGWQASQTKEKESLKDVLFPEAIQSYFNREKTPTIGGEGIKGTDASNQFAEARRLMTQPTDVQMPLARTPLPLGTVDPYQENYVFPNQIMSTGIGESGDDALSGIEGQEAKLKDLALAQYRVLQKKQGMQQFGGEKMTPKEKQFLDILEKRMKEEKMYSIPLFG